MEEDNGDVFGAECVCGADTATTTSARELREEEWMSGASEEEEEEMCRSGCCSGTVNCGDHGDGGGVGRDAERCAAAESLPA